MALSDFLAKVQKHAKKQPSGGLTNLTVAGIILAQQDPDAFASGLKFLAASYGKPVVKATLVSIVEAALE